MDMKKYLIDELSKIHGISDNFIEKVYNSIEQEQPVKSENTPEVSREMVIDYLVKAGYELTDENFNYAQKMLSNMDTDDVEKTMKKVALSKVTLVNHLNDFSIEELSSLISLEVLNSLLEIKSKEKAKYNYEVETIKDIRGQTDVKTLTRVLKQYGRDGYRVVSIFTNELGKNAMSINGIGTNSTCDEVIVVFEKVIYDWFDVKLLHTLHLPALQNQKQTLFSASAFFAFNYWFFTGIIV